MSAHTPRSFEVPAALVAAGFSPVVDLDALDREVEFPGEVGEWAEKVLFRENTKTLDSVCGSMRLLPRGILSSVQLDDDSLLVSGLVDSDGRVWDSQFNAWGAPSNEVDLSDSTVILSDDEVAFVARALLEGADEVWFRPFIPKAFVSAIVAAPAPPRDRLGRKSMIHDDPPTPMEIPPGSAIVAVVDPIDEDAVLEMLAITPGPHVARRHDGNWFEDPEWVSVLRSVKPPKIVKLSEAQTASVATQVDRSTNDQDWEPFEANSREQYQIFTASAYVRELERESDERALFALVAVAGREVSPKDVAATERLKRYWTVGRGAAKIRWGTPGSWRRCYRHLVKYVGPRVAPGYCTNLSMRLGGPGIATHVGDVKPIPGKGLPGAVTAANPYGENGYDNGQSWNEGAASRDSSGHFAPKGTARAARRSESISKTSTWDESKAKYEILPTDQELADQKKADAAKAKAKREQQQEQLAQLSLQIAQASAAGDTVKAAELRVKKAELTLSFADTPTEKLNAQTALINARSALARAKKVSVPKLNKGPYSSYQPSAEQQHDELMDEFNDKYATQ